MVTPVSPESGTWNKFSEPKPYAVVMGLPYDVNGNFPIFFRSDKVRSAKLNWSIVSGCHEPGFTLMEQFAIECHEEFNLTCLPETGAKIGFYENIAAVDNWHWVINLVVMRCQDLRALKNKEPEKHSDVQIVNISERDRLLKLQWTPGLGAAWNEYYWAFNDAIEAGITSVLRAGF